MRCRSSPRSVRGALGGQHFFRMSDDLQQARARELEEIKSELRVLEIDRAQFVVRQRHHVAAFDTFDRLRPAKPGVSSPSSPKISPGRSSLSNSITRNRPLPTRNITAAKSPLPT